MGLSFSHLLVLVLVGVLLFGRGRISDLMGDVAKGIKSFKKGLSEDDTHTNSPPPQGTKHISADNLTDITSVVSETTHNKNSNS